jgi:hypothetical protein
MQHLLLQNKALRSKTTQHTPPLTRACKYAIIGSMKRRKANDVKKGTPDSNA